MRRDLDALASKLHDVVVVGGGITGACIARDAALRGLSVAVIEQRDFSSGTSAATSKLVHGGLRYLKSFEFGLVRESLRERRTWMAIAPHMVRPIAFLLPFRSTGEGALLRTGLRIYDLLSWDRDRVRDPDHAMPPHRVLSLAEAVALEPVLEGVRATGVIRYFDGQMESPERLGLECLRDAAAAGAEVANYAEVTGFGWDGPNIQSAHVRDRLGAEAATAPTIVTVRGRVFVNAAGPWADRLLSRVEASRVGGEEAPPRLARSKGVHVVVRGLTRAHGVTMIVPASEGEGHFFVRPWLGHTVIGTTDTPYYGDPDDATPTERDVAYLLARTNHMLPAARLSRADVLYAYAGLRPLVQDGKATGTYDMSRRSEIVDHKAQGGPPNLFSALGGKWTTSRLVAEHVVDKVCARLGVTERPSRTATTPLAAGAMDHFAGFADAAVRAHDTLDESLVRHLARTYGARLEEVLAAAREPSQLLTPRAPLELFAPLAPDRPGAALEVVEATREELACTLEDVLFRRTNLGALGPLGDAALARVVAVVGAERGWDVAERDRQAASVRPRYSYPEREGSMTERIVAVVNPASASGRTHRQWQETQVALEAALGPVTTRFTDAPLAATRITADALADGAQMVIAVGGDGTLNEVVNGFFDAGGKSRNAAARLGLIMSGTGGDFRKTLGRASGAEHCVAALRAGAERKLDVGRVTFTAHDGSAQSRYFINIASFGLSGIVALRMKHAGASKRLGSKLSFLWNTMAATFQHQLAHVRVRIDDGDEEVVHVHTVAVANGQYYGGGMKMAPDADPGDGLFDVVLLDGVTAWEMALQARAVYRGSHVLHPKVKVRRGRKVSAIPCEGAPTVLLDVDGEAPGRLPATFELLPGALTLVG